MAKTFRSLCNTRASFAGLVDQFTKYCWLEGWRIGKVAEQDKFGVFQGLPPVGKEVKFADGSTKALDQHSRVRLQDLHPDQLAELGITPDAVAALPPNKKNIDVWHPEFVRTYEELVAKSDRMHNYVANNGVGATSILAFLAQEVADDETTVGEMADRIDAILAGNDPETALAMNQFVHGGWMARAVCDLSYRANDDFVPPFALTKVTAEIDQYVAVPVLTALRDHLRSLNS